MYSAYVASVIRQYSGMTNGVKLVDHTSRDLAHEDRDALLADFSLSISLCRVLFASIIVGMGENLVDLWNVWCVGQPETLITWVQMFGRAGRDRGASEACLFFHRGVGNQSKTCMKDFCLLPRCLQLQVFCVSIPL